MELLKLFLVIKGEELEKEIFDQILQLKEKDIKETVKISPPMKYKKYAVNSESGICSDVGVKILERGGNAMDAAIASILSVGVVNSFSSGIGGGGFLMLKRKDVFEMFDFRETAPSMIDPEYFKNNPNASKFGAMSISTPGEVMGLYQAHKEHGVLEWKDLFTDVIELAEGFKAEQILINKLKAQEQYIFADEGLRNTYTRNGKLIKVGDTVERKNLAKTLKIISKDPMSFYKGELADKIVEAVKKRGGVLSKADLENYESKKRSVVRGYYKDFTVYTTNLPTSGPLLIQALNIMKRLNIESLNITDENIFNLYHMLIEIFKFMYSERGQLADPDFLNNWKEVVSYLIMDKAAEKIYNNLNLTRALERSHFAKALPFAEDHGTSHLNAIDEEGMVVQITSSINLGFGSKILDDETGIIFNNSIDDFYIPGIVNEYGLKAMFPNIIEGNKRPFSSMCPMILERDGEMIVLGAAGGTRIPTSILGVLANLFIGKTLHESIMSTRIHDQLLPNVTYVEADFPPFLRMKLEELGHSIEFSKENTLFTSVQGMHIKYDENGERKIEAVSDERKHGRSSGL